MAFDGFQNLTMQQLEALIHLVEERSFSRAARKMHLTQPSLTKHIHNVEDALGAKIVDRSSRGLALTPEGRVLYDYARRIVKLRDEARERVLRLRECEKQSNSLLKLVAKKIHNPQKYSVNIYWLAKEMKYVNEDISRLV